MANLISNYICVTGNAKVSAHWENYVTTLSQYENDFAGLTQFLWPTQDPATIDLGELTGTKRFELADLPATFDGYLRIQSDWAPCTRYIADLWRQLRAIDPKVIVQTLWQDQDTDDQGTFALTVVENSLALAIPPDNHIPHCTHKVTCDSYLVGPAVPQTANSWRKTCAKIAQIVANMQDKGPVNITVDVSDPTGKPNAVIADYFSLTATRIVALVTQYVPPELAAATANRKVLEMMPEIITEVMNNFQAWVTKQLPTAKIAELTGDEWGQLFTTFTQELPIPYADLVPAEG